MEGATGTVDAVVGPGSTFVSMKHKTNHVCFFKLYARRQNLVGPASTLVSIKLYARRKHLLKPSLFSIQFHAKRQKILKSMFLSDPGLPGVRSMGPVLSH